MSNINPTEFILNYTKLNVFQAVEYNVWTLSMRFKKEVSPVSSVQPKMVNAPEGLNQVILRKVRIDLIVCLPKRLFFVKNVVENICQVMFPLNFTRNNSCRACFEMRFLE